MHFFFYEIVARVVAIYVCIHSSRALWYGFVERQIAYPIDIWDLFRQPAYRDYTPRRYWTVMGLETIALIAGLIIAIFGWPQLNP